MNKELFEKDFTEAQIVPCEGGGSYDLAPVFPMNTRAISPVPEPAIQRPIHLLQVKGRVLSALSPGVSAILRDPCYRKGFPDSFQLEIIPLETPAGKGDQIGHSEVGRVPDPSQWSIRWFS